MKRNRFTEEQIIGILKEHEAGTPVSERCRNHGVSGASIYKWKVNCPPFRPDSRHKQKGSSTGLSIGLCPTTSDALSC